MVKMMWMNAKRLSEIQGVGKRPPIDDRSPSTLYGGGINSGVP